MALRDINMMPAPQLEKRRMNRHLVFWAGCLMGVFILIACLYFGQTYLIFQQKQKLTQMKSIPLSLQSKIENVRRLQADQEKIKQQQAVLNALVRRNQSYPVVLFRLSQIMNNSTWLVQLAISSGKEKEAADRLLLTGLSLSNEYLGDFLNRLSQEPLFKNVALKYIQEGEKEDPKQQMSRRSSRFIHFQIECGLPRG